MRKKITTLQKVLLSILLLTSALFLINAHLPAYQLFTSQGEKTDFETLVEKAKDADIVFFGEQHTTPIDHWLQFRLVKAMYEESKENLVIGAEMFESDGQLIIDEYFAGNISQKSFEAEARLWKNYKTDYKPVLEFAKENNLKLVATNIPRRYAAAVAKNSLKTLDTLSDASKKYIADLPIIVDTTLIVYKEIKEMMSGGGMKKAPEMGKKPAMPSMGKTAMADTTKTEMDEEEKEEMKAMRKIMKDHNSSFVVEAQASKDATMAKFILENFKDNNKFIHFDGSKHSDHHEGIVWHIKQTRPDLKILVIASTEQSTVDTLETDNKGLGDFILVTPDDMTKTSR